MKKQWFSFIVDGADYPEDQEVCDSLNKISDKGVPDESIKLLYDGLNNEVTILYRHTHKVH